MTLSELLTDLATKSDILWVGSAVLNTTVENIKWYDVPTVRQIDTDFVQGASQPVLTIDEGTVDEAAYYNAKKNFIETAQRDQLYTDTQIESYLTTNYPNFQVIEFSVKIDGMMDIITVKALDNRATADSPTAGQVITIRFAAWDDNGTANVKIIS